MLDRPTGQQALAGELELLAELGDALILLAAPVLLKKVKNE